MLCWDNFSKLFEVFCLLDVLRFRSALGLDFGSEIERVGTSKCSQAGGRIDGTNLHYKEDDEHSQTYNKLIYLKRRWFRDMIS